MQSKHAGGKEYKRTAQTRVQYLQTSSKDYEEFLDSFYENRYANVARQKGFRLFVPPAIKIAVTETAECQVERRLV